jgi:hypothetical protein
MSRGVVLWPDAVAAGDVRELWVALSERGLPSLATHSHRRHQPHCSLSVAEELAWDEALDAVGVVPSEPIPLLVGSVGVFPPDGALVLACVANRALLSEQRRVHRALAPVAVHPWSFFEGDAWIPHVTLSTAMTPDQLATAIPLVMERLPLRGIFDRGGVEDGTTGENWPAPSPG